MGQKILVIKHGALGDLILSVGVMAEIRKRYPDAHITLMTSRPFVKMMEQSGFYNDIVIDNRPKGDFKNWYRVCKNILADGGFDLIFNLQLSRRVQKKYYKIARFLTKGPFAWAYFDGKNSVCLTRVPAKRRFSWGKETVERFNMDWPQGDLSFMMGEQKHFHLLPERYVLLIPGCSAANAYKRWPASSYAELAKLLAQKGIQCVVLGTKDEAAEIEHIVKQVPTAVDFMGKSSLLDIPALVARSICAVGNDTGPTHMASLCNKPVVALFCQRTAHAARDFANVTNLIGQDISDIAVQSVYDVVMNAVQKGEQ